MKSNLQKQSDISIKGNSFNKLICGIVRNTARYEFIQRFFHDPIYLLRVNLQDCRSVLDLGCGCDSPLRYVKHVSYSLGVDAYSPDIRISRKNRIHNKYKVARIEDLSFPDKSFDAVILLDVLEHLPKKTGLKILRKAENWSKKRIIVTAPNGFVAQSAIGGNIDQIHKSGWSADELRQLGYVVWGTAGAKYLYKTSMFEEDEGRYGFNHFRFHPQSISFFINAILELIVYYYPEKAFSLFAVKKIL